MLQSEAIPPMTGIQFTKTRVACAHGRMIDDVLTEKGVRTGMVRCLECLAIIPDPYVGRVLS